MHQSASSITNFSRMENIWKTHLIAYICFILRQLFYLYFFVSFPFMLLLFCLAIRLLAASIFIKLCLVSSLCHQPTKPRIMGVSVISTSMHVSNVIPHRVDLDISLCSRNYSKNTFKHSIFHLLAHSPRTSI